MYLLDSTLVSPCLQQHPNDAICPRVVHGNVEWAYTILKKTRSKLS
jgi:hypothetical protein